MPDPLLTTKLRPPRLSVKSTPRPRLTGLLDASLQAGRSLTLISAPAGFGKTSLLGEWASHSRWRITWLSLDEEDNDPVRFWSYFTAALQVLREDLGENARAMLNARYGPPLPDELFLTVLLNEISTFAEPFALALEDYHLISSPTIHTGLTFLIDHLPNQMHLILTNRSDPPLPLGRWRAGGKLAEIRADDLRFTKEEAASFLTRVLGLPLSTIEVSALNDRTEGWIAGLQLASIAMSGGPNIATFIADFTGSHHYIGDYLTEEILQRQPEPVKSFLLSTSILDRMCAPLCEAVTGQPGGQEMLERLERANLFLQPLDDERRWYRYHRLFADVLRHRLRLTQPDLIPKIHHDASEWYAEHGLAAEAIRHALAGKVFGRAADLIEANAATFHWMRVEMATLSMWLEALPDELVRSRPRLCLLHAWALLLSGQLTSVESRLEDLEKTLAEGRAPGLGAVEIQGLRGQVAAIRARLARIQGDLPRSIELCRQALETLPREEVVLRGVISLNLGLAYWQSGEIAAASQVLEELSAVNEPGSLLGTSLAAQAFLADLYAEQGRLRQAVRVDQLAIERSSQADGSPSPVAAWAYIGIGRVQLQWNELGEAGGCFEKGLELAVRWGNADGLAWAYLHLAKGKAALSVPEEAEQALSEAERIIRQSRVAPWTASEVVGYRGRLWILQGNISEATLWAQEHHLEAEGEINYQRLPETLSLARLLLKSGKFKELESLLDRMLGLAESSGLTGRQIELLLLRAFAFLEQEKMGQAKDALEKALVLARAEGYRRLFLDEGEQMKMLLEAYFQNPGSKAGGADSAYARSLLNLLAEPEEGGERLPSPAPQTGALLEPLSERELELLQLMAQGLPNREIAQRLYISTGTVKVHLKHIFRKLDVSNRTEAAARARLLSLI